MGIELYKTYTVKNKKIVIKPSVTESNGKKLYRISVDKIFDYIAVQKIKEVGLINAVDNNYIREFLMELRSRLENGTYEHLINEERPERKRKPQEVQKSRNNPTSQRRHFTDYSNSYVSGDMGRPNTTFWNGYR